MKLSIAIYLPILYKSILQPFLSLFGSGMAYLKFNSFHSIVQTRVKWRSYITNLLSIELMIITWALVLE